MVRKDRFDAEEEDFYEALYTQSQAAFGSYVQTGGPPPPPPPPPGGHIPLRLFDVVRRYAALR